MFKIIRVCGSSMEPNYNDGDYVIVFSWLHKILVPSLLKAKRDIVFTHPALGTSLKRIRKPASSPFTYEVYGTNPQSVTPEALGDVRLENILGFVVWRIQKSL